ncbi:MAG: stage V sporulation protein AD [Oscillospiraceae bacterium]|nr:stage V sporulation protein AD [Oscillospiraceae bacterium]
MEMKKLGRVTYLSQGISLLSCAAVGGKQEGEGPLGHHFDEIDTDSFLGCDSWEQAESELQRRALQHALRKGGMTMEDLDAVLTGDLLNQCIGGSFALRNEPLAVAGLYSACATMGEGLVLSSLLLAGGAMKRAAVMASSHFCAAERQYRMPLPYGSQRSPTAQWTATAAGCCLLGREGDGPYLTHAILGRIVDMGITDATNMGAAMAPAAIDTLTALFQDTHTKPQDYDLIVTGDLGAVGHGIVADLMGRDGFLMDERYTDCGLLLYDRKKQDMHAGGSGAGCSASVLCAYLLAGIKGRRWKKVIFAPTGALLSPTTTFQKESIPAVCHAVVLSAER